MELLPAGDPDVQALEREEEAIRQAEAAYRADPELAQDLERSGWFEARTQAAKEGRAIRSEGQQQAEPVLALPVPEGQVQFKPSAWAGFTNLLRDVAVRRVELLERRRPQVLARLSVAEADLRDRVLETKVRDLDELVTEANELLAAAGQARGPVPRTIPTAAGLAPAKYREHTDALELVDAALGGWSLLDPVPGDEPVSIVSSSYGVQRDTSPPPARDAVRVFGTTRG